MAVRKVHRDPLPEEFSNIEEAAAFWDTHSLADYEDLQKDVEFEVNLRSEKNCFANEFKKASQSCFGDYCFFSC